MILRPPRSTLFPTRRSSDLLVAEATEAVLDVLGNHLFVFHHQYSRVVHGQRSEEHTSELQSRLHLVCRLLLEKKKIIINKGSPKMNPNMGSPLSPSQSSDYS